MFYNNQSGLHTKEGCLPVKMSLSVAVALHARGALPSPVFRKAQALFEGLRY